MHIIHSTDFESICINVANVSHMIYWMLESTERKFGSLRSPSVSPMKQKHDLPADHTPIGGSKGKDRKAQKLTRNLAKSMSMF